MIYNSYSTVVITSGTYNVAKLVTSGSVIYADKENDTTVLGGTFALGNAGEDASSTKPWIFNVHGKNEGNFINVTGGTFNQNPLMNYGTAKDCEVNVPEGYASFDNGNGTWTIKKAVAKIENVYYETLQDAINAAAAGATIELIANVQKT